MRNRSHFQKGFAGQAGGAYKCGCCSKLTRETGDGEADCDLCRYCFRDSGWENHHNDNHGSGTDKETCEKCKTSGFHADWRSA